MFKSCPCCGANLQALAEAAFPEASVNPIVKSAMVGLDSLPDRVISRLQMSRCVAGDPINVGTPVYIAGEQQAVEKPKRKLTPGLKRRGRLTSERAAKMLGIDQSGMCKMRKRKTGPKYDFVGGKYWYKYDDVMTYKRTRKEFKKKVEPKVVNKEETATPEDF